MACNKEEQGKTRTLNCEERGNKMATQAIPPPPIPSGDSGARSCGFRENLQLASFGRPWRTLTVSSNSQFS